MKENIVESVLTDIVIDEYENEKEEESESISQIVQEISNVNEGPAFVAVRKNDIPKLSAIIFTGYDINCSNENEDCPPGKNPFYEIKDWARMVRVVRLKGYTPFHLAVVHSTMKMIKYLMSKGADVNVTDANLMSPLSLAAAVQRADIVRLLIRAGAIVDSQSVSGRTPLLQAISTNNLKVVRQLLRAGASPDLADTKGTTPLLMCLQAKRNDSDNSDNLCVLQSLIDAGCTVDLRNKQGATALMLVVGIGRMDAADLLLKAGAQINLRDKSGQTVMHLASGTTTAIYLLHKGATSDAPDLKGTTPLDKAAKVGHIPLMNLFLASDSPRNMAILDVPRVIQVREQFPLFDHWLQQEICSPRTLRRLCRQDIRQYLSPSNTSQIPNLPVPQMVKDFLLCKHLDMIFYRPRGNVKSVPTLHP